MAAYILCFLDSLRAATTFYDTRMREMIYLVFFFFFSSCHYMWWFFRAVLGSDLGEAAPVGGCSGRHLHGGRVLGARALHQRRRRCRGNRRWRRNHSRVSHVDIYKFYYREEGVKNNVSWRGWMEFYTLCTHYGTIKRKYYTNLTQHTSKQISFSWQIPDSIFWIGYRDTNLLFFGAISLAVKDSWILYWW